LALAVRKDIVISFHDTPLFQGQGARQPNQRVYQGWIGSGNEKHDALARMAKDRILARTSVDSRTDVGRAGYDMGRCYIGSRMSEKKP